MSKRRNMPVPFEDVTTEHTGDDPIYQKSCQELIDQSQWAGSAPPVFPSKVIVHHIENHDDVRHIYRSDKGK